MTELELFGVHDAPVADYDQPAHPDDVNNVDDDFQGFIWFLPKGRVSFLVSFVKSTELGRFGINDAPFFGASSNFFPFFFCFDSFFPYA